MGASEVPMEVYKIRIPHGAAGTFSGWYSFVRGATITRRKALRVLLFGPMRAKIETAQSNDQHFWGF